MVLLSRESGAELVYLIKWVVKTSTFKKMIRTNDQWNSHVAFLQFDTKEWLKIFFFLEERLDSCQAS